MRYVFLLYRKTIFDAPERDPDYLPLPEETERGLGPEELPQDPQDPAPPRQ